MPPYRATVRPTPAAVVPVKEPEELVAIEDTPRDLDEHPDVPGFNKPLPIDRSIDRRRLPTRWRNATRRNEGDNKKNR